MPAPPLALSDLVDHLPGVSLVGQGGRLQTYAIRGLSQERIRVQYNGTPLRGLRRAGISASFLPAQWMTAGVDRRSRPVEHGSGSVGGVIGIERAAPHDELVVQYEQPGSARSLSVLWGGGDWTGGLTLTRQGDHRAPDGEPLNDSFRSHSVLVERDGTGSETSHRTSLLFSEGRDIGKSASNFPERRTVYPLDRHLYLAHRYSRGAGSAVAWLPAQRLETEVVQAGNSDEVEASVLDYGIRYHSTPSAAWTWGLDVFGRGDYQVVEDGMAAFGSTTWSDRHSSAGRSRRRSF